MTCYRGDSIQRFGIKYPLYLDSSMLSSSEINKLNRVRSKKIIVQNICSREGGIFATVSKPEEVSLDTVTNITLEENEYLEYFTALLNSKISNFFMIFVVYLNSNFAMHTDKTYIGEIPIIIPTKEQLWIINDIFNKLSSIHNKYSSEFFEEYGRLNKVLYEIYKLTNEDILVIEESLKDIMSKKQNGG